MKKNIFIILTLFVLISSHLVFAAPGGADVTSGSSEKDTETSVDTAVIEGGNVTFITAYSKQITGNWAGFFGNVTGSVVLADSSSNIFYQWTISNFDNSVVYASSGAISDWSSGNIVPANSSVVPAHIQGSGIDNFTNTFSTTDDFNSTSLNKAAVPYVDTLNGGAGLRTYALYATAEDEQIWAGAVQEDSASFKGVGVTVDYQVLVPAQALTTYSFYLELP